MTEITKAVIPAAGWGTRLLPATKAIPKEMVPVLDRPVMQWAVEEAAAAGLSDICVVTSRAKSALEQHFAPAPELEAALEERSKTEALEAVRRTANLAELHYTTQESALGLGHAVAQAAGHTAGEAFAVLLPDVVMDPRSSLMQDLVDVHRRTDACVLALIEVEPREVSSYGCAAVEPVPGADDSLVRITAIVEKPSAADAPSRLTVAGRYVLTPAVMDALADTAPSAGGEIQLTDAIAGVIARGEPVYGHVFRAGLYDTGSVLGLIGANVAFGLADPAVAPGLRKMLEELTARD